MIGEGIALLSNGTILQLHLIALYTVHACIHVHVCTVPLSCCYYQTCNVHVVVSGLTSQCSYMCRTPPTWKRSVLGSWPYSVTVLLDAVLFMVTVWVDLRAKESMSCQCVCVCVVCTWYAVNSIHNYNQQLKSVKYLHHCHTCIVQKCFEHISLYIMYAGKQLPHCFVFNRVYHKHWLLCSCLG